MTGRRLGALAVFALVAIHPATSSGHGTERHFGTKINDRGSQSDSGGNRGAPEFAILSLRTTLNGMERALDEGRIAEVRERATRLPRQALDLIARTRTLESAEIDRAARRLVESVGRLGRAEPESQAFRVEISRIREELLGVEDLLPQERI